MEDRNYKKLELMALKIRRDVVSMLYHRGYGHIGGSLSLVEAYTMLYGKHAHVRPQDPLWKDRDRIVLSKGHAGPVMYSTLAECGFFPKEWLFTLNDGGTRLPSHTDRLKTPGVDATTGSLGQGTSEAVGIACALKKLGSSSHVFLFVGDGELNEGQCWEAFQFLAAHRMDNVIVFIDDNKKQLDGWTRDVLYPFDYAEKMKAFGFYTQKVNGQDLRALDTAITNACAHTTSANCIVLDTVKGAGVRYFEEAEGNHSMKWGSDEIVEATKAALVELDQKISALAYELNGASASCPCSDEGETSAFAVTALIEKESAQERSDA